MLLGTLLSLAVAVVGTAVPNGQTLTLNGIAYYVSGIPVSVLRGHNASVFASIATEGMDLVPLTVLSPTSNTSLDSLLSDFMRRDDVFQPSFLRAVYFSKSAKVDATAPKSDLAVLESYGNSLVLSDSKVQTTVSNSTLAILTTQLPNGPYFVSKNTGGVFRAYRLYPDDNLAFIQGAISDENGGFLPLPGVTENAMTKDVAVPSRLYYEPTPEHPLAGLRLGVKDIFHVQGLKTSGGSRSYYYLYGTQNVTAPSIQKLLDLGAVFIGKTGTVQFANGDRPTADWVDFHCPFNPRGEGYQSPSGSSSGSGAAIAAYDWLDLAVGSDTGGSMRSPAAVQGIYGNRPSTGAITLDHVLPLSPALDTTGIFARNASLWAHAIQNWYPNMRKNHTSYPRHLLLAGPGWDGQGITPEANRSLSTFVRGVEAFLGSRRTMVDVSQHWRDTNSPTTPSLEEMLYLTYATLTSVDQYNHLATPLFADYKAAHRGRQPFINPGPLARWEWGQANGGNASYEVALRNMTTFRSWWETSGYGQSDAASCSKSLFMSVYSAGTTDYRNQYYDAPGAPPLGFSTGRIAVLGGVPEVVVPVGESPYNSTISLQTEYLPVSVALQMARGCDYVLAELIAGLEEHGVLKPVKTGTRLYL
ncbi:amidase signature domain-containing protein [Aspergillus avenaceus]|uniref:Amidase signature domain-containing protein n=1 Tax=Aspergillus avenaceus TaxID=36643 RepID=A0A5N6UAF2_ASPAV|nr:amidase signature domain-containing protein [Aspergillus avenaceus]